MEEQKKLRLGELLIEAGILSSDKLDHALDIQKKTEENTRLGEILVNYDIISEVQLVQALSRQLSIPWVSIAHIDIDDDILGLVPQNVVEEFNIIPIYVRPTRGERDALYVAMADPTDDTALRFITAAAGLTVKPMIAGPTDISKAIRFFYYDEGEVNSHIISKPTSSTPPPPNNENDQAIEINEEEFVEEYEKLVESDVAYQDDDVEEAKARRRGGGRR